MTKIKSVEQFIERLKGLPEPKQGYTRFFRGHSDVNYKLIPSIYRKSELINNEHKIVRDVLTECSENFLPHETLLDKLTRMQHYDYPTRLLDISQNSLVGLYFALANAKNELKNEHNGEVIVFDIPNEMIKHHDSDTVAILLALSLRNECFDVHEFQNIAKNKKGEISNKSFNKQDEIIRLLNDVRADKPYFLPIINPSDFNQVLCVKPKISNTRIAKQQGAFLIFGINGKKDQLAKINDSWITGGLEIEAESKQSILEELKYFGISHQTLFPELDSQAQHIIGRYAPNS